MRGFTLIEVLIASVILIFSISTLSLVISTTNHTKLIVDKRAQILWQVPFLMDQIDLTIKQAEKTDQLSDSGYLINASYSWTAEIVNKGNAPGVIDQETGQARSGNSLFNLWQVSLTIESGNWQKQYQLMGLSWG